MTYGTPTNKSTTGAVGEAGAAGAAERAARGGVRTEQGGRSVNVIVIVDWWSIAQSHRPSRLSQLSTTKQTHPPPQYTNTQTSRTQEGVVPLPATKRAGEAAEQGPDPGIKPVKSKCVDLYICHVLWCQGTPPPTQQPQHTTTR